MMVMLGHWFWGGDDVIIDCNGDGDLDGNMVMMMIMMAAEI